MARKSRQEPTVSKTIKSVVPAKTGKFELIFAMLYPFQQAMQAQLVEVDKDVQHGGAISNLPKWKKSEFDTVLSARQFQMAYTQMIGMYKGYLTKLDEVFRRVVRHSSLTRQEQIYLNQISKFKAWYKDELICNWLKQEIDVEIKDKQGYVIGHETHVLYYPVNPKTQKGSFKLAVPTEYFTLARKILKKVRTWINRPDLTNCTTMLLDARVASIEDAKTSVHFKRWVKFSTLERGAIVYVPLKNNPYLDKLLEKERLTNTVQVKVYEDHITISAILESKPATKRTEGRVVGLDFGNVAVLTTTDGQRLGLGIFDKLKQIDYILTAHDAELQCLGVPRKTDPLHRSLVAKAKELLKNEVGRILNALAKSGVKTMVFEDLTFQGSGLSKQMNRILSNCGRGAIRAKQDRLRKIYGVEIIKVEPAYTSQMCHNCGYVSKKNRNKQSTFECGCCGLKINADINAAFNIRARRSRPNFRTPNHVQRQKFLAKLLEKHSHHCVSGRHSQGVSGTLLAADSL